MLNAYSQRFADVLFAEFPEWQAFTLERLPKVLSENTEGILIVDVPCPTNFEGGMFRNTLRINTSDNEVLVSWDGYHAHFDPRASIPSYTKLDAAIALIHDLLKEELCIAVAQVDGKWRGAMSIEPDYLPQFHHDYPGYYIRSWHGTYDQPLIR